MDGINISFSYKYTNVRGTKHLSVIVFRGDNISPDALSECEGRITEAFSGKDNTSFIPSQVGIPDIFDYVPIFENDSAWHKYTGCDITNKKATDNRSFTEFTDMVCAAAEAGWEKFDVLEKVTGRISKKKYIKEIETLSKNYTKELDLLQKNNTKELELLNRNYNKEIETLNKSRTKEIELLKNAHTKETDSLSRIYEKEQETLKKNHLKEMDLLTKKHDKAKNLLSSAGEVINSYLEGEATSDELEKICSDLVKMVAAI